jgi:hypothetical protein
MKTIRAFDDEVAAKASLTVERAFEGSFLPFVKTTQDIFAPSITDVDEVLSNRRYDDGRETFTASPTYKLLNVTDDYLPDYQKSMDAQAFVDLWFEDDGAFLDLSLANFSGKMSRSKLRAVGPWLVGTDWRVASPVSMNELAISLHNATRWLPLNDITVGELAFAVSRDRLMLDNKTAPDTTARHVRSFRDVAKPHEAFANARAFGVLTGGWEAPAYDWCVLFGKYGYDVVAPYAAAKIGDAAAVENAIIHSLDPEIAVSLSSGKVTS